MFNLMPFDSGEKNIFQYLDNLEKNFFNDFAPAISQFRTDIVDKGDRYLLQAELPGFNQEDIHIDLKDNLLTIQAEHKEEKEEKDESNHRFIRRERKYGSFARSFDVSGIDIDKIAATYKNGVLELSLPKRENTLPPSRRIEISSK